MLWQKSWWETRWGLSAFMGVMLLFAVWRLPLEQNDLAQWFSSLQQRAPELSEGSRGFLPLLNSYQGYVWYNWFKLLLLIMWPMFAVTMGATLAAASCPWIAGAPGASGLFTFSLPVSRRRVLLTHAALVAVEMAFVALVPSLMFPLALRLIGADVSFGSTVVHALLLTLGGMVFISLTFLLTAVFNSQFKAMAIGIAIVSALRFPFRPLEDFPWWNVYHVMSGETYFRYGKIPWLGLLASLALSALMMLTAVRIYERRDF
jgi:ABC-2 type transport system permease protein